MKRPLWFGAAALAGLLAFSSMPATTALSAGRPEQKPGVGGGPGGAGPKKDEPPFDEVVKDNRRIPGLMDVYEKDGRYLLAIKADQFDRDFMMSVTRETGVGQFGLLSAQVLGDAPVRFHRVGRKVQMILRNTRFVAQEDPDIRRAVDKSFSDSLGGSSKIESQPQAETGAVLVDMTPFFLTDVEGVSVMFAQRFQVPYTLDRENSVVSGVKGFPANIEVEARAHFSSGRPVNLVNVPDARSFFITYRYSLGDVPQAKGFIPRLADDRVGHFVAMYQDFSDDNRETPYVRYVTRWNLQKEEPYAALSKPVEPITYWLENSVPKKYRKALTDGTLMWSKAFEKIGFKDAIVVKQQPDDADWDPADARYSTIRWFIGTDASFAIGPSRANPMTGQIYDADIGWSEGLISGRLREFEELTDPVSLVTDLFRSVTEPPAAGAGGRFACDFARGAMEQVRFGMEMLEARGVQPGSGPYQEYIDGFITYVQAHEMGHTLGLRHNFRASSAVGMDLLQNAALTSQQGLVASVMDYVPVNIAAAGKTQGQFWPTTLGPYDLWAIEYAYRPIPGVKKPEAELPDLRALAQRVAESGLAYGTDEDTGDPRTNTWDLGSDPVAFYADRTSIVRELWSDIPQRFARPGDGYQVMRRAYGRGIGQYALAVGNVTKTIGGLYTHRDHVNDPSGRLPLVPVPAATQRAAMEFIKANVFSADAFPVNPDLLNRLAMTRWWDFQGSIFGVPRMEYPLHDTVLALQKLTLQALYNPAKLDRLVDMEMLFPSGQTPFTMAEMFDGVNQAVWSEVYAGGAPRITSLRRALQREHMKRLSDLIVRPSPDTPEDAVTMARANLSDLRAKLAALPSASLDAATRAHLDETKARIEAALSARMLRPLS